MNEEYRQDNEPRDGKMMPISESIHKPERIDPIDCICRKCGNSYEGERYLWPVQVPKKNYPGKYDWIKQERVLGNGLCPSCRKIEAEEERKAEAAAEEARFAARRRHVRLHCGIETKYQNEDFSSFDMTGDRAKFKSAYRKSWEYAKGFPITDMGRGYHSLVLFSESSWGVGKTHLASAIAHRILDRWTGVPSMSPVAFVSEPELLLKITATYNYPPEERPYRESESDIINRLLYVPLLIIDDVGKRKVGDLRFVQRIHFSIIDGRYKREKPVVMTANLDSEALGRYLGGIGPSSREDDKDEATLDRLIEMCQGEFIQMDGKSYRREKPGKAPEKERK